MCRFALYRGPEITVASLVTEPAHSILQQSVHSVERAEPMNGDGFGVAWYVPDVGPEPGLFCSVRPAWSDMNLRSIARVTRSTTVLAHVRAASPGLPVTQLNCHPFVWGPFAFMHNGVVGGFRALRRRLLERLSDEAFHLIAGSTDSEHLFALFVDHHHRLGPGDPLERMAEALSAAVHEVESMRRDAGIEEPSLLNLALSDGERAVALRYTGGEASTAPSLYLHEGRHYVCEDGECRMVDDPEGRTAAIIASERLSDDPGWERVPVNHLLTVSADLEVVSRPLAFSS